MSCGKCPEPELLPECEPVVALYLRSSTQWVYAGAGVRVGLNYPGCESVARGMGLEWGEIFDGLQIIEGEVLKIDREKSKPET